MVGTTLTGGYPCKISETSFSVGTLYHPEEVFATNSLFEVTPIVSIEERPIPCGKVPPILQAAYKQLVREELGLR